MDIRSVNSIGVSFEDEKEAIDLFSKILPKMMMVMMHHGKSF
jgi:hypothetical protein